MGALEGKVAVVTGSSRGFGLAVARAFVKEGAAVMVTSRSTGAVDNAVDMLKRLGDNVAEVPAGKLVRLVSAATDGRTGEVVREMSPWGMVAGALQEGVRRLLRRPAPVPKVEVHSVPSAFPQHPEGAGL
jgi:NAD(P)-dependent dehydrogenase (short-subunit alcohol dehydrogenase family)